MEDYTLTSNINEKWLNNIYENIKKLEEYERLVREGCSSLLDFLQIPIKQREIVLGLTQFKNLRFFVTEFRLLLGDLTPVLEEDKAKEFKKVIDKVDTALNNEGLFIEKVRNADRQIIEVKTTKFFHVTINSLHNFKVDLFKQIKHILYIGGDKR